MKNRWYTHRPVILSLTWMFVICLLLSYAICNGIQKYLLCNNAEINNYHSFIGYAIILWIVALPLPFKFLPVIIISVKQSDDRKDVKIAVDNRTITIKGKKTQCKIYCSRKSDYVVSIFQGDKFIGSKSANLYEEKVCSLEFDIKKLANGK